MKKISEALAKRKSEGILRNLTILEDGIDFYSNDYLGIGSTIHHSKHQLGSTGSRLLSGNYKSIESLEKNIAKFHKSEEALLFTSGYTANLGLLSAIADRHDTIVLDEHAHASLIDGARMSNAKTYKFKHNCLIDLEKKLSMVKKGQIFLITEHIFSMDGSSPNFQRIISLCKAFNAHLIIDQAHSVGLTNPQDYASHTRVVTFGKAFGTNGAAILCSKELKQFLINFSRPFIYSTAPSEGFVSNIEQAYNLIKESKSLNNKLKQLVCYWNTKKPRSLKWINSNSQIQSLLVPGNKKVTELAEFLISNGMLCLPIKSPTVQLGHERIRFCIHSYNSEDEIDLLFYNLQTWAEKSS